MELLSLSGPQTNYVLCLFNIIFIIFQSNCNESEKAQNKALHSLI